MDQRRVFGFMSPATSLMVPVIFAVTAVLSYTTSAEASGKDDCVAHYQKKAKCRAATFIIADTCKCKYDSSCKYPNSKAIECILDKIGDVQDNSAAYLMRNSCIQQNLMTGK